jgi:hypothetical protein
MPVDQFLTSTISGTTFSFGGFNVTDNGGYSVAYAEQHIKTLTFSTREAGNKLHRFRR